MSPFRHPRFLGALAALALPLLAYVGICLTGYDGGDYLRGDCPYYFWTARSLLADGDLDLSNQLPGDPRGHSDFVSLATDGRVVPKHPVVMPVLALPFIAALGMPGALVYNVAQILSFLLAGYLVASRFARPAIAAAAVTVTGLFSYLPHFVWNFSPDAATTALFLWALVAFPTDATRRDRWAMPRALLAGLLFGFAVWSKLFIFIAFPGFLFLAHRAGWRTLWPFLVGGAIPALLLAWYNQHLFGSPLVFSYDRILHFDGSRWVLETDRQVISVATWFEDVVEQFLDPDLGLLTTSSITVPSLLGLPFLFRRDRPLAVFCLVTFVGVIAVYGCWDWKTSFYGHRYAMQVVAVATLPLAALLDAGYGFVRKRMQGATL